MPITVASVCKGIGPGGCSDTQAPSGHWHSCWCLQGWLWIMSFSDQRPAFWIQAWRDINSLRFCPNGSYSHRILRASEELQIVAPHGEISPPSLPTSGILSHTVLLVSWPERACFEQDGPLFFLVLNIRRMSWWSSLGIHCSCSLEL